MSDYGHYGPPPGPESGCRADQDMVFYSNTQSQICLPKGLSDAEIALAERDAFALRGNTMGVWEASRDSMRVNGTGDPDFDGIYTVDHHYRGVPVYRKPGGYVIFKDWSGWYLAGPEFRQGWGQYFADGGVDYPPEGQWKVINGTGPGPTVSRIYGSGGTMTIPVFPLNEMPEGPQPFDVERTQVNPPHVPLGPAYWESRGIDPAAGTFQTTQIKINCPPGYGQYGNDLCVAAAGTDGPPQIYMGTGANPYAPAPAYEAPVYNAPAYDAPVYNAPASYDAPVYDVPVYAPAVYNIPVEQGRPVEYLGPPATTEVFVATVPGNDPKPRTLLLNASNDQPAPAANNAAKAQAAAAGDGTIFGLSPLVVIGVGVAALLLLSGK